MKKLGRPKSIDDGKTATFHLTVGDIVLLDLICAQHGMNRSEAIRWLIREAMKP
jgi:hypothetical protein